MNWTDLKGIYETAPTIWKLIFWLILLNAIFD